MSNYSKGTFEHQSLRVNKDTLKKLRDYCIEKKSYMTHFADDAIKEKMEREDPELFKILTTKAKQ